MSRKRSPIVATLTGAAAIVTGVFFVFPPAALILAGTFGVTWGLAETRAELTRGARDDS